MLLLQLVFWKDTVNIVFGPRNGYVYRSPSLGFIIGMVLLASFGGYVVASLFFLRFPHILHKKKKLKFKPVHISHRGGAGENCENTITAFKHALSHKTDMLEIDCHLTKDGVVVVSHDQNLQRTCDIPDNIADLNYSELPDYRDKLAVSFQPNAVCCCGEDRKIPTLRDVFTEFPNIPINIDIKTADTELYEKVNALIQEFNREDLVIWGSGKNIVTDFLHKLNPDVPIFFSAKRVVKLLFLFYTGLLPFVPLRESAFEVMMPGIALSPTKSSWASTWKLRCFVHISDLLLMRPALIKHLNRRGIQTYLWVLNEEQEWERGFKLGATGVMTDYPSQLTSFLEAHPEYTKREIHE